MLGTGLPRVQGPRIDDTTSLALGDGNDYPGSKDPGVATQRPWGRDRLSKVQGPRVDDTTPLALGRALLRELRERQRRSGMSPGSLDPGIRGPAKTRTPTGFWPGRFELALAPNFLQRHAVEAHLRKAQIGTGSAVVVQRNC